MHAEPLHFVRSAFGWFDSRGEAVIRVLDGQAPAEMGRAARAFVIKNHEWSANLAKLDAMIAP